MEIRQIRYFIEVAKKEHVTKAANNLHVAQSAVSRQIANLEEELGVALFIREGRNVRLTPIGEIFLKHIEQAMQGFEDAKQVITEYTDPDKGTINIGFVSSLALYIMPTIIAAFRKQYPAVNFTFIQGNYYELKEAVIRGKTNLALLAPVPAQEKRVKGKVLATDRMAALLPATHNLAQKKELRLHQLRQENFILYPKGFVLRDIIVEACTQAGFKPDISPEADNMDSIKGLVSAGLGISVVPESTLRGSLPLSTVHIPIVQPVVTRTVGVIIPRDRDLLPTEKIFYDFVTDFFNRIEQFQY